MIVKKEEMSRWDGSYNAATLPWINTKEYIIGDYIVTVNKIKDLVIDVLARLAVRHKQHRMSEHITTHSCYTCGKLPNRVYVFGGMMICKDCIEETDVDYFGDGR